MKDLKNKSVDIRSEEVQEIMEKIPHWILRYGNSIVFLVLMSVFSLSYFIPYPDIKKVEVTITTVNMPQTIVAQSSGRIEKLMVNNGDIVSKDQPIAIMESNANFEHILKLKKALVDYEKSGKSFPFNNFISRNLGEIEMIYAQYETIYFNTIADSSESNIRALSNSIHILLNAIDNWEYNYVIKSKIAGRISFIYISSANQDFSQGDVIFATIPLGDNKYIAKAKIKINDVGKIRIGLRVKIHMDSYSDFDFGVINGRITAITEIPDKNGDLWLSIDLPNQLTTSYNKSLDYRQQMTGEGDIIIEQFTLLQRLLFQFRTVI